MPTEPPASRTPSATSPHFEVGARRALTEHQDLGTRLEFENIGGHSLMGVRLIDYLVEAGPIEKPQRIAGPDGAPLRLEPSANGRFVRVWRG